MSKLKITRLIRHLNGCYEKISLFIVVSVGRNKNNKLKVLQSICFQCKQRFSNNPKWDRKE